MALLIFGLIFFLGTHSISIAKPQLRETLVARFGPAPWQGIFALLALAGFAMLVSGYGSIHVHQAIIYDPPAWMRHVTLLLMLPVFPLLFAAYMPGRIQTTAKHPMLLAVKIWAFAHLLANGGVADLLLFGSFLAWAVADRISLKRRVGPPVQGAPARPANDAIAIVGGLALYLAFIFWLHHALIGVSPIR